MHGTTYPSGRRVYVCREARWRAPGDNAVRCDQPRLDAEKLDDQPRRDIVKRHSGKRSMKRSVMARVGAIATLSPNEAEERLLRNRYGADAVVSRAVTEINNLYGIGTDRFGDGSPFESKVEDLEPILERVRAALRSTDEENLVLDQISRRRLAVDDQTLSQMAQIFQSLDGKMVPNPMVLEYILLSLDVQIKLEERSERRARPVLGVHSSPSPTAVYLLSDFRE